MARKLADGRALVKVSPTTAGILLGESDLSEWSDEELIRGRRKSKDGNWSGRPPEVVPAALHQELTRRRFTRAFDLLAESLVDAALMLRSIVNDSAASSSDRIRAAEVMFDRVIGKPKESVDLALHSGPSPWERLVATAIVGTVEQAEAIDVEAEEILDDTTWQGE